MESAAAHVTVVLAALAALAACVLLQYETLIFIWRRLSSHKGHRRVRVLHAVVPLMALHAVEVSIFGATLYLLALWPACGGLAGQGATGFFDYIYFSAITFSTVGFGELWPVGAVRFLVGLESLAGLLLIAWSASFTYLEMEKAWR